MDLNEHDHSGTSTSTSAMTCELAYVPTYGARNTSGYRHFGVHYYLHMLNE